MEVARERNGIIINADSLQIFDALPLLTAQPSPADKEAVPHRLYGLLPPAQSCSAMMWRDLALIEIRAALSEGKTPVLVGGTGFYLKALIEGLSPIPEIPEEVRLLTEDIMDRIGVDAFFAELSAKDPETAARLDPKNRQRLVRAWEVLVHTGKGLSYWHTLPKIEADPDLMFEVEIVMPLRQELYDRCDRRFLEMIKQGAVEEVRVFDEMLMAGKIPVDAAVTHALGFEFLQQHVRGEMDLETAIFMAQNETRHYAKRQSTWFRHQMRSGDNLFIRN
jgi:tRNA dimethylallyltransferase